ncbi:hypothetical protein K435DRAFT_864596 [Dendrothele bispora CBS 962.96]|uniref:Uncharacterized protein n=1 Tax=Dendrothele bispora (strain CBS 962.96) TaxID=1314807 RepID=A0A4S8LLN7_DENBC|nr:hypothetical protein K435DRAFT_864596 [Dendrothele bispora CBS 962.96]
MMKPTDRPSDAPDYNSRNQTEWKNYWMNPENITLLLSIWQEDLVRFFDEKLQAKMEQDVFDANEQKVILALREMRCTTNRKTSNNDFFLNSVKKSTLVQTMLLIVTANFDIERMPKMDVSFQKYRWKETFRQILYSWIPDQHRPSVDNDADAAADGHRPKIQRPNPDQNRKLLETFESLPFVARPELVFLFSSEDAFCRSVHETLLPNIKDPELIDILKAPDAYRSFTKYIQTPTTFHNINSSPIMNAITKFGPKLKDAAKQFGKRLRQKQHCRCPNDFSEQSCCRKIYVRQKSEADIEALKGKTLREFENKADVPLPASKETISSVLVSEQHGFIEVKSRREILRKCGQDVVIFIDADSEQEIGGVSFGAIGQEELKRIQDNHEAVFNQFSKTSIARFINDSGVMTPAGSRLPQGGRPGDTYTGYQSTCIVPEDLSSSVQRMLQMGQDMNIALQILKNGSELVHKMVIDAMKDAGTYLLGPGGMNAFYCHNYIAPQHFDQDETFTITFQTKKTGHPRFFNFAFSQYGIILHTETDTTWWFYGGHLHGTIVPTSEAVKKGEAVSDGITFVLRRRDAQYAKEMRRIQQVEAEIFKYYSEGT